MKIRTDFVTNSSSSSFVTVTVETFDEQVFTLFDCEEDFVWQEQNMPEITEAGPHIQTWSRNENKYKLQKLHSVEELAAYLYFNGAEDMVIEEYLPIFSYLRDQITEAQLLEALEGISEYDELREIEISAYSSQNEFKEAFRSVLKEILDNYFILDDGTSLEAFCDFIDHVNSLKEIHKINVVIGDTNWDEFMESYVDSFYSVMDEYADEFSAISPTDPNYKKEKKKWTKILQEEAFGPNIEVLDGSYEELAERALASGSIDDMMPRSVLESNEIVCDFTTPSRSSYFDYPLGYTDVDSGLSGGAFSCCDNLREVVVPEGITEIGSLAFAECSKLERVYIPATVTQIDETAFDGCGNVTICAPKNSVAHIFAEENGILFEQHGQVSKTDVDLLADQTMIDLSLSTKETLEGKTFVVTGDLYNYPSREDLKKIIEQHGGKLTGSVSSKTTALITNFPASGTTKIKKAQELGIKIITEEEFVLRYLSEQSKNTKMLLQTEDNTEITTTGNKAWESLFAPWILERGRDYVNAGRVFDIQQRPGEVYAKIEGQDSYDVSIIYNEAREIQDIQCTCPYAENGNYCKHSAALLYAFDLDLKPLAETEDWDEFDEEADFDDEETEIDEVEDDFDGDSDEYVSFNLILGVVPDFDTTFYGVVKTIKSLLSNVHGAKSWSKGIQADRKNGEIIIEEGLLSHEAYDAIFPKMCEEIAKTYPLLPFQGVAEYSELRGDSGEVCLVRYYESKLSVLNIASGCRLAICPECDADILSLSELAEILINNPDAVLVCDDCGAEFTPQELFEDDFGLAPSLVINTYDMSETPSSKAGSLVCTQADSLAAKALQEEAERKCQEEAAAQARALEMVRKAAEEEKQRREAEERKRLEEEELKRKESEEQKRREEEERKQKEAEARRIAEEKYKADLKSWEKACENIKKQREQAVTERIAAEKATLEQAAQKAYDTAVSAATNQKKTAQQNKADAELRLSKLGLFKFTEKNAMKEAILQADAEIADAEKELERAKQALNTALAAIPAKVFAQEPAIRESVEEELAFPAKPANPNV